MHLTIKKMKEGPLEVTLFWKGEEYGARQEFERGAAYRRAAYR